MVAMDVVLTAGSVDINSGDEKTKMTESENKVITEEAMEKIGGSGLDSRGRRKSKYLSYPYTNVGQKQKDLPAETEDLSTPCLPQKAEASSVAMKPSNGSSSYAKLGSKRFRRNWYRKFISDSTRSRSPKFINSSSDALLSRLYSTAVNCMFPIENKSFDLVEWFFCRYRISQYHDEAELATSLVNEERKIGKPLGNDLSDMKSEKKRKNNKMENAARPKKTKSLSGLSDMNANTSCGDNSLRPGRKQKQKRKVEGATSLHQSQIVEINLNERSNNYSSVPAAPLNLGCLASEGKAVHKKREKIETSQEHQSAQVATVYTDAERHKSSALVIDLQFTPPPIPAGIPEKSNGHNKEELHLMASNREPCVSQGGPVGNIPSYNLSLSTRSEFDTVLKNGMEKAAEAPFNSKPAIEIPDLNSTGADWNSVGTEFETVNFLSPELKSEQSRRLSACSVPTKTTELKSEKSISLSACTRPAKTTNYNRMEDNGESLETCLLLRFAPGVYIPSKEDLMTTFCRFGPLKASETQMLKDTGNAQIVFVRSADAAEAFRSLEQNKLFAFGSTLVDCKLHHLSAAAAPRVEQLVTPTRATVPVPMPGERPSLQYIKQNLHMMTSVLENSGNTLSPQMRAKLDTEIKSLMRKVNSMTKV